MDISDLIKKHSLSAIEKVKRINPSSGVGALLLVNHINENSIFTWPRVFY